MIIDESGRVTDCGRGSCKEPGGRSDTELREIFSARVRRKEQNFDERSLIGPTMTSSSSSSVK